MSQFVGNTEQTFINQKMVYVLVTFLIETFMTQLSALAIVLHKINYYSQKISQCTYTNFLRHHSQKKKKKKKKLLTLQHSTKRKGTVKNESSSYKSGVSSSYKRGVIFCFSIGFTSLPRISFYSTPPQPQQRVNIYIYMN